MNEIESLIDEIELLIQRNGELKTEDEINAEFMPEGYYEDYPDAKYHIKYSDEIITKLKESLKLLKKTRYYSYQISRYLGGKETDITFIDNLKNYKNDK